MNNAIPRAQSPLVDRAGHPTREWYSFFLSALEAADGDSDLEEQIRAILARLAALEDSSPLNFQLLGLDSVVVSGTPQNGYVQINLDGDTGEPGGTYFYGTGPDGSKGWQLLGDAFVAEPGELTKDVEPDTGVITLGLADVPDSGAGTLQAITVDAKGRITGRRAATITGTAGQIAVANGNASSGLPTISLVDVPDAGGGTLQKTQFDAKGRKTGTSTATTDDLAEGSANLYFTTGRAAAAAPVQSVNGETGAVVLVPGDLGLSAGNAGQFWRGDGVFSNSLSGPISVVSLNDAVNASGLTVAGYSSGTATVGVASNGRLQLSNSQATDTLIDIDPQPGDATSTAQFRFFRNTNTTGATRLTVYLGDGTANDNHRLAGKGTVSYVCSNNGNFGVGTSSPNLAKLQVNGDYAPHADNTFSSGLASRRHSVVWAGTGAISTSDAREKTTVRALNPAELAAAIELGREIGCYQWLAMIATKGDGARRHIGMTVQRAIEIMLGHGLDPFAYGFICYDQWDELPEIRREDGELVQEARPAGDRYSFRMDELLAFIARGLAHRLDGVEQRLTAAGL